MKFLLNPGTRAYLQELSTEFGIEMNRLFKTKIISTGVGQTIEYQANVDHLLFK